MSRVLGILGVLATLTVALSMALGACAVLTGCHAFEGPATKEHPCPVNCGRLRGAEVCCAATEECSVTGWPDKPCRPVFTSATRKDAGP